MLEALIRPQYQRFMVNPMARALSGSYKITPLQATIAGGFLGLSVPLFLVMDSPYAALVFLALSGYFDTLDGTLARLQSKTSNIGCVLDIMTDRLVESAVIMGLFLVNPLARGGLCLAMLISILLCVTSFLVVGIFTPPESEKSFHYSPGLMERPEAFIFFAFMILLPQYFAPLALLFIFLVLLTAYLRLYQFIKHTSQ